MRINSLNILLYVALSCGLFGCLQPVQEGKGFISGGAELGGGVYENGDGMDASQNSGDPPSGAEPAPIKYIGPRVIAEKISVSRINSRNRFRIQCKETCLTTTEPPTANFCIVVSPFSSVRAVLEDRIPTEEFLEAPDGGGGANGAVILPLEVTGDGQFNYLFVLGNRFDFEIQSVQVVHCAHVEDTPEGPIWEARYSANRGHVTAAFGIFSTGDTSPGEPSEANPMQPLITQP